MAFTCRTKILPLQWFLILCNKSLKSKRGKKAVFWQVCLNNDLSSIYNNKFCI